jgi:photosystem II stability/assembly factor-like uncharacterized protein
MKRRRDVAGRKDCGTSVWLAILLGFVLADTAPAELEREWDPTPHDWIFDVATRGDQLWAVGNRGTILRSTGDSWTAVPAPDGRALLSITFDDSGWGAIVGQMGVLLEIAPQEGEWTPVDLGSDKRLLAVESRPDGEAIAVGQYGTIYHRSPATKRWTLVANPWVEGSVDPKALEGLTALQRLARLRAQYGAPHLYGAAFAADGTSTLLVGERGMIARLVRSGETLDVAEKAEHFEESLFAVARCDGHLVAVGQEGRIAYSEDDGATWTHGFIPDAPGHLFDIDCGENGEILVSSENAIYGGAFRDGAWEWTETNPDGVRLDWIATIHRRPDGEMVAVGSHGVWRWPGILQAVAARSGRTRRMTITGRSAAGGDEDEHSTDESDEPLAAAGVERSAVTDVPPETSSREPVAEAKAVARREPDRDAAIRSRIEGRLGELAERAEGIEVRVENGIVRLSGTVSREEDRERAIRAARETEGVRDVDVNLLLTPASEAAGSSRVAVGGAITTIAASMRNGGGCR